MRINCLKNFICRRIQIYSNHYRLSAYKFFYSWGLIWAWNRVFNRPCRNSLAVGKTCDALGTTAFIYSHAKKMDDAIIDAADKSAMFFLQLYHSYS